MKGLTRFLFGPLAVAIVTLGVYLLGIQTGEVRAQTTITFAVVGTTQLTLGAAGDVIVIAGRATSTDQIGNCFAAGTYPVQNGVAIDPGDQRATRIIGAIVGQATAIQNGTKLGNLTDDGNCTIGTESYKKVRGTVQ